MEMQNFLVEDFKALGTTLLSACNTDLSSTFIKAVDLMLNAFRNSRKVIICGNGGSAADAEHMTGELVGRFGYDRKSLPCISLCTPSAAFTAIANDYGFDHVFRRQIQGYGCFGDILIGISTSGNSRNVLEAFKVAKEMQIKTILLTGQKISELSSIADVTLRAPSSCTPRIQEIHAVIIHSFCRAIEEGMFPVENKALSLPHKKIIDFKNIEQIQYFAKAIKDKQSVFTNGCFDILHPGHIQILKKARLMGDLLIMGLNTDASIKRLKGFERPYHKFEDRAEVLAALEIVDYVIGFDEDTPELLIKALTPKILVKGGDYKPETIIGADWVISHGGEVRVVPLLAGHSTTGILNSHGK